MEVQFTPEQEARILKIASYDGTPAEELVKQAALRMIEEDEQFRADSGKPWNRPTAAS